MERFTFDEKHIFHDAKNKKLCKALKYQHFLNCVNCVCLKSIDDVNCVCYYIYRRRGNVEIGASHELVKWLAPLCKIEKWVAYKALRIHIKSNFKNYTTKINPTVQCAIKTL